jgi:crossover junction endodeoxyribonuclease RusA
VTWTLEFDYPKPPLSLNYRLHRMKEAALTKQVRAATSWKARSAKIPPMDRCEVSLVWFVRTHHRRDDENPVSTLKAMCDGLVDAGVVKDDTHAFMVKHMPEIVYLAAGDPYMALTVEAIA